MQRWKNRLGYIHAIHTQIVSLIDMTIGVLEIEIKASRGSLGFLGVSPQELSGQRNGNKGKGKEK